MGFADANSLLHGPRQPIGRFDRIGDFVEGTLVDAEVAPITTPQGETVTDVKTGAVKQQIIYTLQTDERDPEIEDDDGQRRVFAKWAIQKAISECLAEMGLTKVGLQEGGKLRITHTKAEKSKTRGFNDTKLFSAQYTAPPARRLASAPSQAEPAVTSAELWHNEEAPADAPVAAARYTQQAQDLAFSIYNSNPDTPLTVIASATKISVEDLESLLLAI